MIKAIEYRKRTKEGVILSHLEAKALGSQEEMRVVYVLGTSRSLPRYSMALK